jgi:hypothetical protein
MGKNNYGACGKLGKIACGAVAEFAKSQTKM